MELKELFNWKDLRTKIMATLLLGLGLLIAPVAMTMTMYQDFYGYETSAEGVRTTYRERHSQLSNQCSIQVR